MIMEILTGSGGSLSYLQDILGGGGSVLVNKKEWGDSVQGGFCPRLTQFTHRSIHIQTIACSRVL